jgi:hypothetical protein
MRTDYSTEATLGENFKALINVEIDQTGDVSDVEVFSQETGQNLTGLIYGSAAWDQAWSIAERRTLTLPAVQKQIHRTFRELCNDTPFQ